MNEDIVIKVADFYELTNMTQSQIRDSAPL